MATTKYPLPAFYFNVSWEEGETVPFSEVSGLSVEIQPIEYRDGESREFTNIKMPGLKKYGNISLKRGAITDGNTLFNWWNAAQLHIPDRKSVTISLLNEKHTPVITWKIKNAFPVKLDSGSLNAKTNEVLIETLELAHEGITVEHTE